MTDDDAQFEQARDETDRLIGLEAQLDQALAVPAPEYFVVDRPRLEQMIPAQLPVAHRDEWNAGLLTYSIGGFDHEYGWGRIAVSDQAGRVVDELRCHWSTIAADELPAW
jgi:hypothetical protein